MYKFLVDLVKTASCKCRLTKTVQILAKYMHVPLHSWSHQQWSMQELTSSYQTKCPPPQRSWLWEKAERIKIGNGEKYYTLHYNSKVLHKHKHYQRCFSTYAPQQKVNFDNENYCWKQSWGGRPLNIGLLWFLQMSNSTTNMIQQNYILSISHIVKIMKNSLTIYMYRLGIRHIVGIFAVCLKH